MSIRWLNWSGLRFLTSRVNPRALRLEDPHRVAAPQHIVRFRVGGSRAFRSITISPQFLEKLQRVVDGGQRAQAEEVELDEPHPGDRVHLVLRRDLAGGLPVQGAIVGDRPVGDHHRRGVGPGVPIAPLDLPREAEEVGDLRVRVDHFPEARFRLQRVFHRHLEVGRDHLGDPVDLGVRHLEDPSDVADGAPGLPRPERDELGDVLLPVLALDVGDHFLAPVLAEVAIDVGEAHPLGVQEPFEQELYRIESTSVIRTQNATRLPAALPRPGPTGILSSFAQPMKSATIRK